jgi:hypothetical protein
MAFVARCGDFPGNIWSPKGMCGVRLVLCQLLLAASSASAESFELTTLGPSASGGGLTDWPRSVVCVRLAVDRDGGVFVAWADSEATGASEVYLRAWNGSSWAGLDGSDRRAFGLSLGGQPRSSTGYSCLGTLAIDSANRLVAAYSVVRPSSLVAALKRWNGTRWEELSDSGSGVSPLGANAWWVALVFDEQDRPVLAWDRSAVIEAMRWNGSRWTEFGGSVTLGVSSPSAASAVASATRGLGPELFVAWTHGAGLVGEAYVRRWDGTQWNELAGSASAGGVSNSGGRASRVNLSGDGTGALVATWTVESSDGGLDVVVGRWDRTRWQRLGSSLTAENVANATAQNSVTAFDSRGRLYVLWEQDDVIGHNVHLAEWVNGKWREINDATRPGQGISGTGGTSTYPNVSVGPDDSLYVVWQEFFTSGNEAYLKRIRRLPPDGGSTDADAGTRLGAPAAYDVRCGCTDAPTAVLLLLLVFVLGSVRRRHAVTGRPGRR